MESTKINKFVNSFLSTYNNEDLSGHWNSPETQDKLSATLSHKKAKRGKSSYLFFCADKRSEISKQIPGLKAKEVTTELAARWRDLKENNPKMFSHYEELATTDKARYEAEKQALSESDLKVKKTKVTKKDKTGPKRGKTSYLFFCAEERVNVKLEHPELKAKEITVELGIRWQRLKEDNPDKVIYFEDLANQDKLRYESEKLVVETPPVPENKHKVKGFQIFCKEKRGDYSSSGNSAREVTEKLTSLWKNLPKNVQREYKNHAKSL